MTLKFLFLLALAASIPAIAEIVTPNENLVTENIPPIPAELAAEADRYTEFRSAGVAGWHPTKRELLIRTRFGDTYQLHRVAAPMGAREQLTFFDEPVGWADYEPRDGRFIVFGRDVGGSEFHQNFRLDLDTKKVTLLTDGKKRNSGGSWSNGGEMYAYDRVDANESGAFSEIRIVNPSDPSSERVVTTLEGGGWYAGDWTPDDKRILLAEYISANEVYLWFLDVESGKTERITPKVEGKQISYGAAELTPDGKGMYLTTDRAGEFHVLNYLDFATNEYTPLTNGIPWDVDSLALTEDGRYLAFTVNEAGRGRLHIMDTATREIVASPELPSGLIYGLDWHNENYELAFALNTARSPSDVYSYSMTGGQLVQWTKSETGMVNTDDFPEAKLIEWKSFDDRTISGFLYEPPARFTGPRPVIMVIHGGPEGQSRPGFLGSWNYYLNELGIALVFPNVRGSDGFGKSFLLLDNGFKREDSYRDIETLLDWIAEQDSLDADRIMVIGGSYGGHMVLATATRYPERIACAVDIVGISNLRTFLENTQGYRRDLRRVEYGDERDPEMRAFLDRIAPLTHADKITKPLFVIQGKNDPRVPISESDQIVQTLKDIGTPVWYLVANDEGHGFKKKANADFQFYATVAFVKEHLLGDS